MSSNVPLGSTQPPPPRARTSTTFQSLPFVVAPVFPLPALVHRRRCEGPFWAYLSLTPDPFQSQNQNPCSSKPLPFLASNGYYLCHHEITLSEHEIAIMASQLTAAVFEAAALAVKMKSQGVAIPSGHLRGYDATISTTGRTQNLSPELQFGLNAHVAATLGAPIHGPSHAVHPPRRPGSGVDHLGGVNVVEAKASDEGTTPMFHLLAETSSAISSALLAKHHLPGILLQHGPLAIRHITSYLIASLPGFSTIPPAKQRRIVVGALEGKGGASGVMGEVGGVDGDVIFEKIGWGRWDARRKGDPPRERPAAPNSPPLSASSPTDSSGIVQAGSYTESGIFHQSEEEGPHNEDVDMADAMSVSADSSEDDDMTDEEDWAQMGAAALRRQRGSPITSDGWDSYAQSPASGFVAHRHKATIIETAEHKRVREEREAVEALVKLSSV